MRKLWERVTGLKKAYRGTFATERGKRVLKDLMSRAHVFGTTFEGDPCKTAYNEGRRSMVLHIMQMLEVNPEQYRKLYGESVDEYLETQYDEGDILDG